MSDSRWTGRRPLTRREWLSTASNGFGMLALSALLAEEAKLRGSAVKSSGDSPATAKSVIFCFMDGGPSHVDTFDPKPLLKERQAKPSANRPSRPSRSQRPTGFGWAVHGSSSNVDRADFG